MFPSPVSVLFLLACHGMRTVKELCSGYNNDVYSLMENDELRSSLYFKALEQYASNKIVLDLGTGALALLARYAVENGAQKV